MFDRLKALVRGHFARRRCEDELDEEIGYHVEMETRANIESGMSPAEARRVALRDFGGATQTAEAVRDIRATFVDPITQDVTFALRQMRRSPIATAAVLLTLALGIAGTTTVFALLYSVLIRSLPFPDADHLIAVTAFRDGERGVGRGDMSPPDVADLSARSPSITALVGYGSTTATLTGFGEPTVLYAATLSGGLLTALQVRPALGRDIAAEECGFGGPRVVVISYAFWRDRLGLSDAAVGRVITLNRRPFEVIGVAPEGFGFPEGTDVWIPHRFNSPSSCGRGCHTWQTVGRIAPDATVAATQVEADAVAANLSRAYPQSNADKRFHVDLLQDRLVGHARARLWILFSAVTTVLLIACGNVAVLLLIRAQGRTGELAVRTALGASRPRLVRQMLAETAVLAAIGGAVGVMLSYGGVGAFRHTTEALVPRASEIGMYAPVLLVATALVVAVTLLVGLVPALCLTRSSVSANLAHIGRGSDAAWSGRRSRNLVIGAEVALSIVLLSGSGLLFKSLVGMYAVPLGFETRNVLRFDLSRGGTLEQVRVFFRALEDRIGAIPGVISVASIYGAPIGSAHTTAQVHVMGRPDPPPGSETLAGMRSVSPRYFETMRIPLISGRTLESFDDSAALPVGVVNQEFVRENFPGEDPVGQRVGILTDQGYGSPTWTIVGVVRDVRSESLTQPPIAEIYVPHGQFGPGLMTVTVRSTRNPEDLLSAIRSEVRALDATLPLTRIETMEQAVRRETRLIRLLMFAGGSFAVVSVVLAGIGLYGALAFLVARRTHEIGIRLALGARPGEMARVIVSEGTFIMACGAIAGVGISFWTGRFLGAFLYEVTPGDPWTAVLAVAALLVTVSGGMVIPARRAARVDPIMALRVE